MRQAPIFWKASRQTPSTFHPTRNDLTEAWPSGKILGGSSAINEMIFIRGAKQDYDAWEAKGNTGWGWHDVLPYFRKMESFDAPPDNGVRGTMGPQNVQALRWQHPISDSFIKSFVAAGADFNDDMNGASHEGVAWNQGSTRMGAGLGLRQFPAPQTAIS